MRLGEVIESLRRMPLGKPVVLRRGADERPVTALESWRGSYDQPTLITDTDHWRSQEPLTTVAELLDYLDREAWTDREGYKGGTYTMRPGSTLWADDWGLYESWQVVKVLEFPGKVVISARQRPDEW